MPVPLSRTDRKQRTPWQQQGFDIIITRVAALWPRRIFVQWLLRKPTQSTGYVFDVYRSGGPEGPWNQIASALADTYFFVDENFSSPADRTEAGLHSLRRTLYYKVVVTHGVDGSAEMIAPLEASLDRARQGRLRKLRRDASVSLRKGQGTEVAIFKRKWWGDACSCRAKTGQTTRTHCSNCHGTGIVAGYWTPVYGFAKRSAAPVDVQVESAGKTERHYIQIIMLDIPQVQADDVLVFLRDNKRFIVKSVTTTELQTVTVHQELIASELSRAAVEYDLEADNIHTPPLY